MHAYFDDTLSCQASFHSFTPFSATFVGSRPKLVVIIACNYRGIAFQSAHLEKIAFLRAKPTQSVFNKTRSGKLIFSQARALVMIFKGFKLE